MEIGGLGFFNTVVSSGKGSTQASGESGFKGLFGLLVTDTSQVNENNSSEPNATDITKEELLDLIALLKTDDVLELEEGLTLLNQSLTFNSEEELIVFIQENVAPGVNLEGLIQQVQADQGLLEGSKMARNIEEHLTEPNLEDFLSVLSQLLSMPLKDLRESLNEDMQQLVKVIKLFDLVVIEKGSTTEQSQLKELIQQLTKKLELLAEKTNTGTSLDTSKQSSKMEYLQKTFSTVAAELNARATSGKGSNEATVEQKVVQVKAEPLNGYVQFQQVSKAEQLTLTLTQSGKPTTAADLMKQFESILAKSQFSNVAGTQKLLIKLNPEHLGALRIELIQRDAGLVAKIMTTTQVAKETLETHINGLKHAFGSQNIQVDRLEVSQQLSQQQERFFGREQQQQSEQRGQEQHDQNQQNGSEFEEPSFNTTLEEALVNTEV